MSRYNTQFTLGAPYMEDVRERAQAGDPALAPALAALCAEADAALELRPPSVTEKSRMPPSGDKRDYLSLGPYWWPNPDTADGLPWVRRDGVANPVNDDLDMPRLRTMAEVVNTLSLAWALTGHRGYAQHAAEFLRVWFLNPAKRMNPNLQFGQGIPGICEGRGIGIIDTKSLCNVARAAALLEGSGAWEPEDTAGVKAWLGEYLDWLLTHEYGIDEDRQHNNHGTWYDAQVVEFALAAGREETARQVLAAVPTRRIAPHIRADGAQPHELARTLSFGYASFNLLGLLTLAQQAEAFPGLDLWGAEDQALRRAAAWFLPFVENPESWSHQQIKPIHWPDLALPLRAAARAYGDAALEAAVTRVLSSGEEAAAHRVHLIIPPARVQASGPAGP